MIGGVYPQRYVAPAANDAAPVNISKRGGMVAPGRAVAASDVRHAEHKAKIVAATAALCGMVSSN